MFRRSEKTLRHLAITAIALRTSRIPIWHEAFQAIFDSRQPLVFPSNLQRNDVILVFDDEGVSIVYFDSFEWIPKDEALADETQHYIKSVASKPPVSNREKYFQTLQFQFYIPIIRYSTCLLPDDTDDSDDSELPADTDDSNDSGIDLSADTVVRDIFNVYLPG